MVRLYGQHKMKNVRDISVDGDRFKFCVNV